METDAPGGYFGRALVVDAADASADVLPLSAAVLRRYIGGVGLGTWLMHHLAPVGVDPLHPESPLAFVFSPLVGTPLTTSAKFAVVGKSPLTGLLNDALSSSHFAIAGKLTGNDAIVVHGRAERPSVLLVDGDGARIEPAEDLWGLTADEAEERLRERLGKGWRVASIGPAGEQQIRYATISHDGRHAGRGGLGAVLGAKLIKAVAVRAATKVAPHDQPGLLAAARDLRTRSFGPATAKYRELGTLANLLAFNAISTLPTRNFQAATFGEAPNLAAEELAEALAVHVKGLELPGYEPRTLQAMALGLAVNSRGADHNRSGAYEADLGGELDRLHGDARHAVAAIETEDRAAVMDSLILCKFLRGVFTDPWREWAELLEKVTGWDVDAEELRATARRIVLAKRMFNLREGWKPADDWLPDRFLSEPLELSSGRSAALSPERLRSMIDAYYEERGLDAAGLPGSGQLADMELDVFVY